MRVSWAYWNCHRLHNRQDNTPVGGQEGGLDAAHHQEVERFTQTDNSSPDSSYFNLFQANFVSLILKKGAQECCQQIAVLICW